MPKAENTEFPAMLGKFGCVFYPSVALENSPTETSVVHSSLKSQHFPTAIK